MITLCHHIWWSTHDINSGIVGISPESCHAGLLPQGKLEWILHAQHMTDTSISHRATNNNLYSAVTINDMHRESSTIIPTNDAKLDKKHGPDHAPEVVKTKTCYSRWSRQKKYSHFEGKSEHVMMIGRETQMITSDGCIWSLLMEYLPVFLPICRWWHQRLNCSGCSSCRASDGCQWICDGSHCSWSGADEWEPTDGPCSHQAVQICQECDDRELCVRYLCQDCRDRPRYSR
jgi:hypothetical protein